MVKCNKDQVARLKKALKREKDAVVRQRIQMVLLREDGKTQPQVAELTGVSLSTVNRAHMAYDNGGVNALKPKPSGGRIRENMPLKAEKALLDHFAKAAGAGVNAGAKMHRFAGAKMHQGWRQKAPEVGGLFH